EGDGHVVSAEPERVVDRVLVVAWSWFAGHDVEVDFGVEVFQVERGRDHLVAQGEHGQDGFDGADRAHRVAQGGFGGIDGGLVAAQRVVDGLALGDVTDGGAGGVGVDV